MSNQKSRSPFRDLPFVGDSPGAWNLPATGGYVGGTWAGEAAARAYAKYLASQPPSERSPTLQLIALGIADRLGTAKSDDERDSLRGQTVGFFSAIYFLLADAARMIRPETQWSDEEVAARIQAGAQLDQWAYAQEQDRKWRSEAARLGWETRRKAARKTRRAA